MKQPTVITSLKRLFYIAIAVQVALFVSIAFKWINLVTNPIDISVTIERYVLLITLISIPGTLKLFSVIMKSSKDPEGELLATSIYIKAFITRFSILFLVATINIVLFALSFKQNFMLFTLVTFTAYLFCSPSTNYLIKKEASQINQNNIEK